jgi:hypothetical protein
VASLGCGSAGRLERVTGVRRPGLSLDWLPVSAEEVACDELRHFHRAELAVLREFDISTLRRTRHLYFGLTSAEISGLHPCADDTPERTVHLIAPPRGSSGPTGYLTEF